jgi:hypothetical protein
MLGEIDMKKAFFLGIGCPALITSALNQGGPQSQSVAVFLPFDLVSSAYAQTENPAPAGIPASARVVEVFNVAQSAPVSVVFFDGQDKQLQTTLVDGNTFSRLLVPDAAQTLRFDVGGTQQSAPYSLAMNPGQLKSFEILAQGKRQFGFFQALGAPADVHYNLSVEETTMTPATSGAEGWVYAGTFKDGRWSTQFGTQYLSTAAGKSPNSGDLLNVLFPINLRSEPTAKSNVLAQVHINQQVEVTEVKIDNDSSRVWLKVKVR